MKKITVEDALYAIQLLPHLLPSEEPIGPITKESLNSLSGSIEQVFGTFDGKPYYRFIYHKAAVLFYLIAKDHRFGNGNKRCAVVITMLFLLLNNKDLIFSPEHLCKIALWVAKSEARESEKVINDLKLAFKRNMINLEKSAGPDKD